MIPNCSFWGGEGGVQIELRAGREMRRVQLSKQQKGLGVHCVCG
jgi:hypothetical protein